MIKNEEKNRAMADCKALKVAVWCTGNALVLNDQCSCSTSSPVSTGMGDCLRVDKLSHCVTSHPGQLSLAIPQWVGQGRSQRGAGLGWVILRSAAVAAVGNSINFGNKN